MKKFLIAGVVALLMLATAVVPAYANPAPHVKVDVCHATSSQSNPYVLINVNVNSVGVANYLNGHAGHGGDIWASFVYNGVTYSGHGDQSILANGCKVATPTPTSTNVPTATPTSTSIPTATPTNTPVDTPTSTATDLPTATPINTATDVPSSTPTNQPTDTPEYTPTNQTEYTPTATNQPTDTPEYTPTNQVEETPTTGPCEDSEQCATSTLPPQVNPTATPGGGGISACQYIAQQLAKDPAAANNEFIQKLYQRDDVKRNCPQSAGINWLPWLALLVIGAGGYLYWRSRR